MKITVWSCTTYGDQMPLEVVLGRTFEEVAEPCRESLRQMEWEKRHGTPINTTDHPAVMPAELARRCIVAGSRRGDYVLDPFAGAGTTGLVADRLGRSAILIELNPEYAAMAERRIKGDGGMMTTVQVEA